MLVLRDGQVVVHPHFNLAVGMGGAVFFSLKLGVGVLFNGVVPLVTHADFLVVLDVFVPVALGMQEDLLGTFFVFDAQFVEATATR
ncbi:hypothetical protein D3C81_1656660 [compost metagenome]